MKQLLLVRHAKSSWDDPALSDFDRPLNDRGKKDAPEVAKRLHEKKIKIEAFVSSPAKRARQTCKYFATEFDFKKKKIVLEPRLYEATEGSFYDVVKSFKDKWHSVVIFSHNPGITSFANSLTTTRVDDMPTCSIFAIEVDIKKWKDFRDAKKDFLFLDYPKNEVS